MLKKSVFAIAAALTVAAPFVANGAAHAQSGIAFDCYHDGNPKHFRPECPEQLRFQEPTKKDPSPISAPNPRDFDPQDLFEQMMLDSGGGAGGGGSR